MAEKKEATLLLRIKQVGQEALDRVRINLTDIINIAKGVAQAFAAPIAAYREQERAVNMLNQSLINQGIYSRETSQEYQDLASALQKVTTFGDEQIIQAQSLIQNQIGSQKVTADLTKATLDFAAAQGMDLKSAADLVGKSIGTNTNALARYGIEIDSTATTSEKLAQVTAALNDKFEGQAAAQAEGLGSLTQLKNAFGDTLELIGQFFAPAITAVAKGLTGLLSGFSDVIAKSDTINESFRFLSKAVVTVDFLFEKLSQTFTNLFGPAIELVKTAVADTINAFGSIFTFVTDMIGQTGELLAEKIASTSITTEEGIVSLRERLAEIDEQYDAADNAAKDNKAKKDVARIKKVSSELKAEIIKRNADLLAMEKEFTKKKEEEDKIREENQRSTLSTISTLSRSNNKALAVIGKAAGITQIAIDTPVAIGRALAAFPPPFNFVAAGLVGAAMAAQAARLAGVALAEGGIVPASPGGTVAIIGEGGRDEAVIPLDSDARIGGGPNITVNVYGGLLGDQYSARQLAVALDRELYELRKSHDSLAFDTGIS